MRQRPLASPSSSFLARSSSVLSLHSSRVTWPWLAAADLSASQKFGACLILGHVYSLLPILKPWLLCWLASRWLA